MTALTPRANVWEGVRLIPYRIHQGSSTGIHPWLVDLETKTIRGEALFRKAQELKSACYCPDIVIAHPGWGESLFSKYPPAKPGALYSEPLKAVNRVANAAL